MKEIKIVFNKDINTVEKELFELFIDGRKIENVKRFSIDLPSIYELKNPGHHQLDKMISCSLELYTGWESKPRFTRVRDL